MAEFTSIIISVALYRNLASNDIIASLHTRGRTRESGLRSILIDCTAKGELIREANIVGKNIKIFKDKVIIRTGIKDLEFNRYRLIKGL